MIIYMINGSMRVGLRVSISVHATVGENEEFLYGKVVEVEKIDSFNDVSFRHHSKKSDKMTR